MKSKQVTVEPATHDASGKLTRAGALIEARKKLGEMATISSDERLPRLAWVIGAFGRSIGRGKTWEQAIERSRPCPQPSSE